MNGDLESTWQNILLDIKNSINLPTFKAWFEHISPISLKKNCLTVSVGSHFAKEWLESRYLSLLNDSTRRVVGNGFEIKIISSPATEGEGFSSYESPEDAQVLTPRIRNTEPSSFNSKY
ncbi:MAG: hypothetical protein JW770_04905, partial [Actinobacteria bacterium]|nr:hypothetical protein [Actinomycetota bacterium]